MLTAEIEEILRSGVLFDGEDVPGWLCESAERASFARGDAIYTPADFRRALGVVVSGRVDVENEAGVHLNRLGRGGMFGVAAAFGEPEHYISTVRAASACEIAFIPGILLERLFRETPDCAVRYIGFLTDRVRFLNAKIENFTAPNIPNALELWLVSASGGKPTFAVQSWSGVSRALGISRTSLYRALDILELNGRISRDGKNVTILEDK